VRKARQRCVESGEDHGQADDDQDEVMCAHVGLPDEIALRRSANGHLVAARSDPTAVVAGVIRSSLQR